MTTELDALPETEAIRMLSMFIDTAVGTRVTMHTTRIKEVRAELIRFAEENARLRPMLTARSQEMLRLVSESGELKTRAEKAEARVQELQDDLRDDSARIVREWDDERAVWKQRAERAESELAAVKKRIAEAPKATAYADGDDGLTIGCGPHILACMDESEIGECFAIVKLEDGE